MEKTETEILVLQGKICPYCENKTEYVDSKIIYGKSYGFIYLCKDCDAYCGVHKGTNKSLGRLANKELRDWKKETHNYFDLIWKQSSIKRNDCYKLLANYLKTPVEYCHIGMFDIEQCKDTIQWSKDFLIKKNK